MPKVAIDFTDDQLRVIDWRASTLSISRDAYLATTFAKLFKDLQDLFDIAHSGEATELYRKLTPTQKQTILDQLKDLMK